MTILTNLGTYVKTSQILLPDAEDKRDNPSLVCMIRFLQVPQQGDFHNVLLLRGTDPQGGTALMLQAGDDYVWALTVNMIPYGYTPRRPGGFFAKTYSENVGLIEALEARGIIKVTDRSVPSGYVRLPDCYLTPEYAGH